MSETREAILGLLEKDLIGPQQGPEEVLEAWPSDQYLTGILYPPTASGDQVTEEQAEEDDTREGAGETDGDPGDAIPMGEMRRPASMGLSCSLAGAAPRLLVTFEGARYQPLWHKDGATSEVQQSGAVRRWHRRPLRLELDATVKAGLEEVPAEEPGLVWYVRGLQQGDARWQVTVVLANQSALAPGRMEMEKAAVFQARLRLHAGAGSRLVPRTNRLGSGTDADAAVNAVIYRDVREWAVGHTCSASWGDETDGQVAWVEATWLPTQKVPSMDPDGHPVFRKKSRSLTGSESIPASRLAEAADAQALTQILDVIPDAYDEWCGAQEKRIQALEKARDLPPDLAAGAKHSLARAREALKRIRSGVELLRSDSVAREAYQIAQEAMVLQRQWTQEDDTADLMWRPFQLGFQLLTLESLCRPTDAEGEVTAERKTMDLLWFPTGGGKTEAYLALIAFVLVYRRLRTPDPDSGAGVAAIMRYTLRLLTVQQFERAARLVMACEVIRRRRASSGDARLGQVPFGIGLWVGQGATPNNLAAAGASPEEKRKAAQLTKCPVCNGRIEWLIRAPARRQPGSYEVRCRETDCEVARSALPIYTVDEVLYDARPSLVLGTIDKFAQIVRNPKTGSLFGAGGVPPPELILQDELHLISGPLGTVAGLYEAAVDELCSHKGVPPKVIGSTATIRRAEGQVLSLFNRSVLQFPPPVLDAEDSGFAVVHKDLPGRLYVGVTTAGRSPKFALQAACASLIQGASEPVIPDQERDPYWTLIVYFNSLRELGGALVMMRDDVEDSIGVYAKLHGSPVRKGLEQPLELTSRVSSEDIPAYLDELAEPWPDQVNSSVLATNMISVGVDIPRLGLMVVNGQPKTMSEYIQASSRVGRGAVPGLIVTVYNAGRPRDRSHYESFRTWHQALYREVEASSVTPFAPRARDRALHAALVAMVRHRISGMREDPKLGEGKLEEAQRFVRVLVERAGSSDPREVDAVQREALEFLENWHATSARLSHYWWDQRPNESLLVSAEAVAGYKAVEGDWDSPARSTPNSMREVEPEVKFRLVPRLAAGGEANGQS